jgi:hypothetical protein
MKTLITIFYLSVCLMAMGAEDKILYQNDFHNGPIGKVPEDFMVLDGAFAVQQEGTNQFLELPGAPLESFGALFGPTEKENVIASARIYSTVKGRRYPTFGVGVNGIGGYRLQVSPAKKELELYRGDTLKKSVSYQWEPAHWTHLRLELRKVGDTWKINGMAWPEEQTQPSSWTISFEDKEPVPPGRAGIFGSPFAGTPIRFDDLRLEAIEDH